MEVVVFYLTFVQPYRELHQNDIFFPWPLTWQDLLSEIILITIEKFCTTTTVTVPLHTCPSFPSVRFQNIYTRSIRMRCITLTDIDHTSYTSCGYLVHGTTLNSGRIIWNINVILQEFKLLFLLLSFSFVYMKSFPMKLNSYEKYKLQ